MFNEYGTIQGAKIVTVAGLVLKLLLHVPQTGETTYWKDLAIEVVDMDSVKNRQDFG